MQTRSRSRCIRRNIATSAVLSNRDLVATNVYWCAPSDVTSLQAVADIFHAECVAKKREWLTRTKEFECKVRNIGSISQQADRIEMYTRKFSARAWTGEILQWSLLVFPNGNGSSELSAYIRLITDWKNFTRCRVKFTILVYGNGNHVSKTFHATLTRHTRDWGMRDFCKNSMMRNCIQNDTLNFVVELRMITCT